MLFQPSGYYVIFPTCSMSCTLPVVCSRRHIFCSAKISWLREVPNILLLWIVQVSWCIMSILFQSYKSHIFGQLSWNQALYVSLVSVIQRFWHILCFRCLGVDYFYWLINGIHCPVFQSSEYHVFFCTVGYKQARWWRSAAYSINLKLQN